MIGFTTSIYYLRRTEEEKRIMTVTITPALNTGLLTSMLESRTPEIVVLKGYGAGNIPGKLSQLVFNIVSRGIVVVISTQCPEGPISPAYKVATEMINNGVLFPAQLSYAEIDSIIKSTSHLDSLRHNFLAFAQM